MSSTQLHSSIVALVSLSAGIASKHPDMGLCQLNKLRSMGISKEQIAVVVEIARHIRDEASHKLDVAFDHEAAEQTQTEPAALPKRAGEACCTSTAAGQSCC